MVCLLTSIFYLAEKRCPPEDFQRGDFRPLNDNAAGLSGKYNLFLPNRFEEVCMKYFEGAKCVSPVDKSNAMIAERSAVDVSLGQLGGVACPAYPFMEEAKACLIIL